MLFILCARQNHLFLNFFFIVFIINSEQQNEYCLTAVLLFVCFRNCLFGCFLMQYLWLVTVINASAFQLSGCVFPDLPVCCRCPYVSEWAPPILHVDKAQLWPPYIHLTGITSFISLHKRTLLSRMSHSLMSDFVSLPFGLNMWFWGRK